MQSNCQSSHTTVNDKGTQKHDTSVTQLFPLLQQYGETFKNCSPLKKTLIVLCQRERVTPANEALTSTPVLGNCSTVYQSRRSVFSLTNSFDFLRSSWNSNRFSRCDSGKANHQGEASRPRNNQPSHAKGPLATDNFFQSPSWELNKEPWVGSGNSSWKSVQDGWWKLSRGGEGSMQVLKTGNWCRALDFAERNHSRPSAKPITGSCKACANSVGARWQMRTMRQQIRMLKRLIFQGFLHLTFVNNNVRTNEIDGVRHVEWVIYV